MPSPFLSSEEYDERAHQFYNEGQYDEALEVLREGLALYPHAVELHIGVGYARLAREEYAWARRAFEEALVLEPEHEDALAGLGETLLKFGRRESALKCFRRVMDLGYADDVDLMLQVGRALFREASSIDEQRNPELSRQYFAFALEFFRAASEHAPDSSEAVSCVGYTLHRMADDEGAITTLRRALQLDNEHAEARIYLANILFDRGEHEAALYHLERTTPEDHWDELGIWRLIELKKSLYRLKDEDPELKPWEERIEELNGELDPMDEMLAEVEAHWQESNAPDPRPQLELFGALLADLAEHKEPEPTPSGHHIEREGEVFQGSWEDIVRKMRDSNASFAGRTLEEFMATEARRAETRTGVKIPTTDAESFLRASARAGLLRILR